MRDKSIFELELKWDRFKRTRNTQGVSFDHSDKRFLTMKQREEMIDILFKYLSLVSLTKLENMEIL